MVSIKKIYDDLRYSSSKLSKLHKEIKNDFSFAQGNQWATDDVATLKKAGVKAITINKLKPIIKIITGTERQSRSDFKIFPEGGEDTVTADIATRLAKNVVKNSRADSKMSELFKDGVTGGLCFLEPYMDYSFDLINGDMLFKKVSARDIFFDPNFQEYDMSDCKFIIKLTKDLSMEDLEFLFPDEGRKLKKIKGGKISYDNIGDFEEHVQMQDYSDPTDNDPDVITEITYDLVDYYYKTLQTKYYTVSAERGIVKMAESKEEAEEYASEIEGQVISRKVPVIMQAQCVGNQKLSDEVCWSYPRWKYFPLIPFFAEFVTENMADYSLKFQGIVRGIKDLQEEFNKRRTQELRHLNASANSGFDIEKGQLDEENKYKLEHYGSSPGVLIERKAGSQPLARISPMPLSQGHAQLAAENAQDLKEASGVNPDLLANDSQSQSGRAILFKQRQGLVMIQEILDNYSSTKRSIGKFILSQFDEIFTVESAMKVLGDAYIADTFTVPVNIILERGLQKMEDGKDNEVTQLEQSILLQYPGQSSDKPIVDEKNNLVTAVDFDEASRTINNILNNAGLNKYDVAIGEGPFQDTIRLANFMDLKDLASQGVPIPPNVLIEQSMIPPNEKKGILNQLQQQQQQQQAAMAQEARAKSGGAE